MVTGPGRPTAEVAFADGLTVIEGASNTGKSYIGSLIDYAFGAQTRPRAIAAAKGYQRVTVRLRTRGSPAIYEIERSFGGGDAILRTVGEEGTVFEQRLLRTKHKADDADTLSSFLLKLSGFGAVLVRKNKQGKTRTLSFRDVAFLTLIDEARVISEGPPHLSGEYTTGTSEREILRLMVTGLAPVLPITAPKRPTAQASKAQLQLVRQMATQVEADLVRMGLGTDTSEDAIAQFDNQWAQVLKTYDASQAELAALERERSTLARRLREIGSRLAVTETLLRRFELLQRHYESDTERLTAVHEAGSMLDALPTKQCPVCGAPAMTQHPDDSSAHFRIETVREAALAERQKTENLQADLKHALADLANESSSLDAERVNIREELSTLQKRISNEIAPRLRTTAAELQAQATQRDLLVRARSLGEQLAGLRVRELALEAVSVRQGDGTIGTAPTLTNDLDQFAQVVQEVLTEWNFPNTGRVVFSEATQDLIIGGEDRGSHGKGMRAVTCAAFIAGLMRHCALSGLPHPGLVVLDSPLVAFKPPDPGEAPDADRDRLGRAGVREAFYRSIANGLGLGQVIVLENQEPPPDVAGRVAYTHFSKRTDLGRYGLFPVV